MLTDSGTVQRVGGGEWNFFHWKKKFQLLSISRLRSLCISGKRKKNETSSSFLLFFSLASVDTRNIIIFSPNQQRWHIKMESQLGHVHIAYTRLASICMLSRWLTKKIDSKLSRKFIITGWVLSSSPTKRVSHFPFPPPSPQRKRFLHFSFPFLPPRREREKKKLYRLLLLLSLRHSWKPLLDWHWQPNPPSFLPSRRNTFRV